MHRSATARSQPNLYGGNGRLSLSFITGESSQLYIKVQLIFYLSNMGTFIHVLTTSFSFLFGLTIKGVPASLGIPQVISSSVWSKTVSTPKLENSQEIIFLQPESKNQTLINCVKSKPTNQLN